MHKLQGAELPHGRAGQAKLWRHSYVELSLRLTMKVGLLYVEEKHFQRLSSMSALRRHFIDEHSEGLERRCGGRGGAPFSCHIEDQVLVQSQWITTSPPTGDRCCVGSLTKREAEVAK